MFFHVRAAQRFHGLNPIVSSGVAALLIAAAWAVAVPTTASASTTHTVTFTTSEATIGVAGAPPTFMVPLNVTSLQVEVTGAGGGGSIWGYDPDTGSPGMPTPGGDGATVNATLSVTPGEILTADLGHGGQSGYLAAPGTFVSGAGGGGFGDGGPGGATGTTGDVGAAGGGGATALLAGSTPLVVAGGGGGASGAVPLTLGAPQNYFGCSSVAFGPAAPGETTGYWNPVGASCQPNSSTAVPSMTAWSGSCPGLDALGTGSKPSSLCPVGFGSSGTHDGEAGSDAIATDTSAHAPGGGGGGGWVGGMGGVAATPTALSAGGGQGGSNYTDPVRISGVTTGSAANAGGADVEKFCAVGTAIPTAGDPTTTVSSPADCATVPTEADDGSVTITYTVETASGLGANAGSTPAAVPPSEPPLHNVGQLGGQLTVADPAVAITAQPTFTG